MKILGIIGAMEEEIEIIREYLEGTEESSFAGMTFYSGKIDGLDIVLVRCGIGKVNAAICTQVLISNYNVNSVINIGVAGAVHDDLEIGDIIVSNDVIEHDFDATGFGYKLGEIPRMDTYVFEADKDMVEKIMSVGNKATDYKAVEGRILTGDIFVACGDKKKFLWDNFQGYCTEMEGAAIGHTCYVNNVPFVIIRSMSDKANGKAHDNFAEFTLKAAKNSSDLIKGYIDLVNNK